MKILIIEDEEKLAEVLQSGLKLEGHAVDIVNDGIAGEKRIILYQSDYDIVILDLMLPGKSGLEICKNVRSLDVTIPILILTARGGIDDKVLALNNGADDYLVKPFSFEELLARVHALTRRPKDSLPPLLKVKDLILNPITREVTRQGKHIDLTLKEFEFLQYLMKHAGQVMGREDIYAHLWDFADSSFSNVIDVHVKNLRKKIDEGHSQKLLETIRGVGYTIRN